MFNFRQVYNSFRYALQGLRYVWHNEQNFRLQCYIGLLVILAMLVFGVPVWQQIILFMMIIFVLVLELMNTIMEKVVDLLKPRLHSYVQVIKDMMAGAVLISAVGATIIALLIFVPYVWAALTSQIIVDLIQ